MPEATRFRTALRITEFLKYKEGRELVFLVLSLIALMTFGTIGYESIEGWNLFDSLYMTFITLASIGYGEVHPLSDSGRMFTIVLISLGVSFGAIAIATIGRRIVERQFFLLFERSHMEHIIESLKDHIVICGFGRLGRIAARDFKEEGIPVVVIDKDEEKAREARESGYPAIVGDATLDETLLDAGIMRASSLVALLSKDSDNLYVVLTSRELSPKLFILSRTEDEFGERRLRRAGANRTISPYREGGQKIANALLRPFVTDFIDKAVSGDGHLHIEEIKIPDKSPMAGVSIKSLDLREKVNIIIAAIISPAGEFLVNPVGATVIEKGCTLIVLGYREQLAKLEKMIRPVEDVAL